MKLGVYVLGAAAIASGLVELIWGDFERGHQPIQAWGDNLTRVAPFADAVGAVLVLGGAALLSQRSRKIGALLVGAAYFIFASFWAPRLYWASKILGLRGTFGAAAGVGLELIVIAAVVTLLVPTSSLARWIFGISTVLFGLAHLTNVADNASLVPKWLPPGSDFWVILTGIAFILARIGILSGILDVLAARLLTLMFAIFSALALAPLIPAFPHAEGSWGTNAYNLAAIGSAWVLADWLASRRKSRLQSADPPRAT